MAAKPYVSDAPGTTWYVASDAVDGAGDGSLDNPYSLSDALSLTWDDARPGDTFLLRGGTYSGDFTCTLRGMGRRPITIRPYPGEVVVIDAGLDFQGAYTLWDCDHRIVFRWSKWTGRENTTGTGPDGLNWKPFDIYTPGIQFRNAIIHDYSNVGLWDTATGAAYYGCVTYNIGYLDTDRGHGHILYTQNDTPAKLIKHCMGFNNFGWGVHAYTENGAINNFEFVENVMFRCGILDRNGAHPNFLLGGGKVADTSLWDGNCAYGPNLQFYGKGATNVTFTDNYLPGGVTGTVEYVTNENNVTAPPAEGGTHIRLYADDYDANRAYLVIYNWDNLDDVSVDVSGMFEAGDTLYLWSVQAGVNEAGERQDRAPYTVAPDGTITVDMRASEHPVATPYQWTAPDTTFPTFGAFVVERE